MEKKFTLDDFKNVFISKNYIFDENNLNIIGVRKSTFELNKYDDYMVVIDNDTYKIYEVTTDPNEYWLQDPEKNVENLVLVPNQYINTWEYKKNKLIQCKPVKVWKDIGNDIQIVEGNFNLNIDKHYEDNEPGSIVFKSASEYDEFLNVISIKKNKCITFTLIDEDELHNK